MTPASHPSALGLGIDAGGTGTRWALADTSGRIVAEGEVPGVSASQMSSGAGQQLLREALGALCRAVQDAGRPHRVRAGLTGFGGDGAALSAWLAGALALKPQAVVLSNDIEIAYLDSFAPGEGYLVYAGTGSIAAWIDEDGAFHRAGGRGVLLDDGGGGYWIAREALRRIWRLEDEAPGSWTDSALARAVFAQIGGSDWARSREFMYGSQRGEIGKLALAVAAAADSDPAALAILDEAGRELARLALALIKRCGPRPVALAGRAAELHPAIEAALRAALPEAIRFERKATQAHHAAARLAARAPGENRPIR
jgi:N-acetylglucosamine kinase-like BadF-type ATPase